MSWGSFFSRSTALFLVLPLVYSRFAPAEITLWNLLITVTSLQLAVDVGFTPTFTRMLAFARGGAQRLDQPAPTDGLSRPPNWPLAAQVYRVMRVVYTRLSLAYVLVLLTVGLYFIYDDILALPRPNEGWAAAATVLATAFLSLKTNQTKAYLEGLNHVALLRRWEILTSLGGVLTSFAVLLLGGGVFPLVAANQVWVVINIARNYQLIKTLPETPLILAGLSRSDRQFDREVFRTVWQAAWRTGVGVLLTFGTFKLAQLQMTNLGDTAAKATFTTALRIMDTILDFSVSPLYGKLPRLASLYSQGNLGVFLGVARQSMQRTYWAFVGPVVGAAVVGQAGLALIGSKVAFPDLRFWALLGLASFLQRWGASHLQLYSLSNHIVWHKAGTGLAFIFGAVLLGSLPFVGIYAYPIAGLASAILFYIGYCLRHSYRQFGFRFWAYESTVALPPLLVLLLLVGWVWTGGQVAIAPAWVLEVWQGWGLLAGMKSGW